MGSYYSALWWVFMSVRIRSRDVGRTDNSRCIPSLWQSLLKSGTGENEAVKALP